MFKLEGPMPDQHSEVVRQIHSIAVLTHDISYLPGMVIQVYAKARIHMAANSDWQVLLNPADEKHPHQWFSEASGMGMLISEKLDGDMALPVFLEILREAGKRK